ncbi:hypothetical protein PLANPX_1719 [Lacipirellula parvula]|uniref:DUF4145 domain-containing protein n=2 Tax=Lacipirellula parvula TaxID=2650471 RepID=A0A5K7X8F4_9BACT|nr:hypothetical protein PLANPX_1719 [Lacipirellula parvula]
MFIVAPCYKPPKKKSKAWPKLECPPIDGDLLVDARALYDGGNLVAAAMTARVEIERQLTTLALKYPKFGSGWQGIGRTAVWLFDRRILRSNTFDSVMAAADVGNRAAHGQLVTKTEVLNMLGAVESLRYTVRRKGGVA